MAALALEAASVEGVMAALIEPARPTECLELVRRALALGSAAWTTDDAPGRAAAMGFSPRQARRLVLCAELAILLERDAWAMPTPISGPADVLAHVADIRAAAQERVVALYLDARNRPIHRELVALGGLRASVIQPRDILAPALALPAAALVLVHNHGCAARLRFSARRARLGSTLDLEAVPNGCRSPRAPANACRRGRNAPSLAFAG